MAETIYIRADGNAEIGAGHLMRCLSIADALREADWEPRFILADESSGELIRERGFGMAVLHTDCRKPEEELPALLEYPERAGAVRKPFLLIDSYSVTPAYLTALGKRFRTAFLDDFGREALPVDLVINYNIYADRLPYGALYADAPAKRTKLLLGSRYAPLRRDFAGLQYRLREPVEDILITTGGADKYNVAGALTERLIRRWETGAGGRMRGQAPGRPAMPRFHIVSGPFHCFRDQLYALAGRYPQVMIHENVTNMAGLMSSCDAAVSAAGSTLYELCAAGVPAVYFYFVDNQELPARYFAEDTRMVNAGNYAAGPERTLEALAEETKRLILSPERRKEVSGSMTAVTDAKGADRIAEAIREIVEKG